jgi:hypothetical protein
LDLSGDQAVERIAVIAGKFGGDEHCFRRDRNGLDAVKLQFSRNPETWDVRQRQLAGLVFQSDLPNAGVAQKQFVLVVVERSGRGLREP